MTVIVAASGLIRKVGQAMMRMMCQQIRNYWKGTVESYCSELLYIIVKYCFGEQYVTVANTPGREG